MSTLDTVRLEYFLPEDEPHEDVPRVGDEVIVSLTSPRGSLPPTRFVVEHLDEEGDSGHPGKATLRLETVWPTLDPVGDPG